MYTVAQNDTPATIAAKMTGNAARFPELIAANPHKAKMRAGTGVTFSDFTVGETLNLPGSWHRLPSLGNLGRGGGGGHSHAGGHGPTSAGRGGNSGGGGHQAPPAHAPPSAQTPPAGQAPPAHAPPAARVPPPAGQAPPAHAPPAGHLPPAGHAGHAPHPGHPGHHGHHPPHHGHFPPHFGHGHGWGGWGWGGGWWDGDWWPVFWGVTVEQVDACSWSPYTGDSAAVASKRAELQAAKMKQGEVQFFRFNDVSGIFEFYPAKDNYNIQVDRCDDGVTGVGQNYLWDRYPGEVDPQTPAHTLSVGLAGAGVDGCCGQTVWDPTTTGHHPSCDWEWGTCACEFFTWDSSSAADDPGCTYQEPNYGSDQIHLKAGIGPLGPAAPAPSVQPTIANAGLGQAGLGQAGLGQTVNPDGTITNGDITYTQPTSGPSTPGWPGTSGSTTITPAPGGGDVVTSSGDTDRSWNATSASVADGARHADG